MDKQYIEQAMRTKSDITAQNPELNSDAVHAVMGMVDELVEFDNAIDKKDDVNIIEETGDFAWFCALFENATGEKIVPLTLGNFVPFDIMGQMMSAAKKVFAYGKEGQLPVIAQGAGALLAMMLMVVKNLKGLETPDEALQLVQELNIKKLQKRFPEKFTQENASNRDLEAERKTLES